MHQISGELVLGIGGEDGQLGYETTIVHTQARPSLCERCLPREVWSRIGLRIQTGMISGELSNHGEFIPRTHKAFHRTASALIHLAQF